MKFKLFLSLSLLTAIFSMSANEGTPLDAVERARYEERGLDNLGRLIHESVQVKSNRKQVPTASTTSAIQLNNVIQVPASEKTVTYFEPAKTLLNNGCKAVMASANFVATSTVKGYKSSLKFIQENKKPTAIVGAVAVAAALGYVAYKYRDAIFGNSKKATIDQTPVVTSAPVRIRPFTRS